MSGVAGWLYADALMALAVLFLVTSGLSGKVTPPSGSPPSVTSVPTSQPPKVVVGIEKEPKVVVIKTNYQLLLTESPGEIASLKKVAAERIQQTIGNRRIGIVLNFGVHRVVGRGQRIAEVFNDKILSDLGFGLDSAALRNFDLRGQGPNREGEVVLELYLIGE